MVAKALRESQCVLKPGPEGVVPFPLQSVEHGSEPLNDLPIEIPTSGTVGLYRGSWGMVSRAQWHRLGSLLGTMCSVNLGPWGKALPILVTASHTMSTMTGSEPFELFTQARLHARRFMCMYVCW